MLVTVRYLFELTERARQGLRRHICKLLVDESGLINVIRLDSNLENNWGNALQEI